MDDNNACRNDDRRIWSECDGLGERYITTNASGGIGVCVGGHMVVKAVEEWHNMALNEYRAFKAKDKAVEPLAVLAARKGFWLKIIQPVETCAIRVMDSKGNLSSGFDSPTYAAAEANAREWLEKQEDK